MADARAEVAALWRDGRYAEALSALDAALLAEPSRAELHADAAGMRAEMYDPARCLRHARRARELAPNDCSLALRVASALKALGLLAEARDAVVESLATQADPTLALLRDAAAMLVDAGDYAGAEALLSRRLAAEPGAPEALRALAEIALWRGDLALAESRATSILEAGEDVVARTTLGAARALRGDYAGALEDLDRAVALAPGDATAAVWRADALRRAGRVDESLAEARRGGERAADLSDHVAAQLVIHLASLQRGEFLGPPDVSLAGALEVLRDDAAGFDAPPPPALPEDLRPPHRRRALALEDALSRLRGNRSATPTYVRGDGSLVRLIPPRSPRAEAKQALWRFVASADVDEALAVFDDIHARWPDTPEPYNYRGELYLYLGDAASARAQFERALSRYRQSRWAYIGLAGAAVIDGDFEAALRHLADGVALAGGPGPTTFVYRGEALRGLGRVSEARDDLTRSVEMNPGRVGAWVNLCLLELDAGDASASDRAYASLSRCAGVFVREAESNVGAGDRRGALREMLSMLRGNRGSSCVTYFTRAGVLRAVRPAPGR